ncbi:MAG: Tim44-like domain-containing protein [Gammaproteobacteria bacterium]|nr:Tim44-like domain-containing protein [Gammaproteobacteria bacterium]
MKALIAALVVGVMTLGFSIDNAEAKRMGNGKSFGGKQSFSQPQNRSAQKEQAAAPTAAPQQGAGAAAAASGGAAKAGLMGALGGLMIGGLLGALFFGGAFENINFMDILIIALIAFVVYKIFASRRRAATQQQPVAAGYGQVDVTPEQHHAPQQRQAHQEPVAAPQQKQGAGFDTDLMFKGDKPDLGSAAVAPRIVSKPAGFDEAHFLTGAKELFVMMQKAWDNGDLADIREFTTDAVFAEIQDQYRAREGSSQTEVISAHAELFDVREIDNATEAAVLFTMSLKEDGVDVHAQEIWHFTKPKAAFKPTWYLDGIQQVEA